MGQLRVLVVDDHAGVRMGIASLVDAEQPRMGCVGCAGTVRDALALTSDLRPDVVVLDVLLGGDDGLALIPLLRRVAPCAIVVLTSLVDPAVANYAVHQGAFACCTKAAPASELIAAIEAAGSACALVLGDPTPLNAAGALSYPFGINRP